MSRRDEEDLSSYLKSLALPAIAPDPLYSHTAPLPPPLLTPPPRHDEEVLSNYLKSRGRGRGSSTFTVAAVICDVSGPMEHPLGHSSKYAALGVLHTMDEV